MNKINLSPLILVSTQVPTVQLTRDITKHLKQGHRWAFSNCFDSKTSIPSGVCFIKYRNEVLGLGIWQNDSPLKFRLLCLSDEFGFKSNNPQKTLEIWSDRQWGKSLRLREAINSNRTNAFRLLNGEGDGFPGLVIDIYNQVAVLKFDQESLKKIWNVEGITERLKNEFPQLECVYLKRSSKNSNQENQKNENKIEKSKIENAKGENLYGVLPEEVTFKENGLQFSANIREGSKTGFFLDQRENRELVRHFSKNKTVLNLFSYTGGFSIYTAAGGAKSVTSVDIAAPAIEGVKKNFEINGFNIPTENIAADVFEYLDLQIKNKIRYDLVICDPPSFAPNENSVPQAMAAYTKVFSQSLRLVQPQGYFAASSCSSHINLEKFIEITKESFSKARLRGTIVQWGHQPFDHPYPLAMPELHYLKFVLFRLD